MLDTLIGGIAQGLIWAILALGVYITYKILDFPDLSVDGTLATGGCIAIMFTAAGIHPLIALLVAFLAGALAGTVTALLNTKLKIPAILSGILTMYALYSINKRILGGKGDVGAPEDLTIIGRLGNLLGLSYIDHKNILSIIISGIGLVCIIAFMYWFFGTETGSAIRATGDNPIMATAQGINTDRSKIIALAFSNGLAALAGGMLSQHKFQAGVNMATGTIVIGLASVIIGELIFGKKLSFWLKLSGVVAGSIIYWLIFVLAVMIGINSDDLKLITSIIIIIALCIPKIKNIILSKKKKGVAENA